MLFKDFSILALLRWLYYSAEQNYLGILSRNICEEYLCEIILNFNQWFSRRCRFEIFLIYSSDGHLVRQSKTNWAILAEGIMRNISVKLY